MSSTPHILFALLAAVALVFSTGADATTKPKEAKSAQHPTRTPSTHKPAASRSHKRVAAPVHAARKRVAQRRGKLTIRARHAAVAPPIVIPVVDAREVSRNPAEVAREFDRWLDGVEASNSVPGLAAAIVKDDRVLLERGIGFSDWSTRAPVTSDTVFRLASLSKAFATALTGLLVDDGLLHWDTKVASALPTFALNDAAATQRLSVADILSQRAGLPHNTYDNLLEQDEPYEVIVNQLRDVPLACPVGDCYGYQNIAFALIGDVVFAATGDFYSHQVETRIFQPLDMTTASYGRVALEATKSWAHPHHRVGSGWEPYEPNDSYYHVPPAAGVNASIHDMEQWLIAQMGGRPNVLSPALLDKLHTPLVATEREMRASPWRRGRLDNAQYALGWRIYDYAGTTLVFHAGAVQGYRAMIAFLPKYRFGAVMMWNCESGMPSGLIPMLLDRYLGLPGVDWAGIDEGDASELAGGSR